VIQRATDAKFLNYVANHPAVRPDVADAAEGVLDLSVRIDDALVLTGEHGAFIVFRYGVGTYECHSLFLPDGRGEWGREFAEAGLEYMFCATDCIDLLTRVPQGHVGAKALARICGFEPEFTTPAECLFRGQRVPCAIRSLSLQRWATRAPGMAERGAKFHDWLNTSNLAGEPHAKDPDHNRVVGITIAMFKAGQPSKATAFYNRWATAARHEPIRLLSHAPPQISFDAGVLTLENGEIRLEARH
jgi:hypothetical protein